MAVAACGSAADTVVSVCRSVHQLQALASTRAGAARAIKQELHDTRAKLDTAQADNTLLRNMLAELQSNTARPQARGNLRSESLGRSSSGIDLAPDAALTRQVSALTSELAVARARLEAAQRLADARALEVDAVREQLTAARAEVAEARQRPRMAAASCQAALPDLQAVQAKLDAQQARQDAQQAKGDAHKAREAADKSKAEAQLAMEEAARLRAQAGAAAKDAASARADAASARSETAAAHHAAAAVRLEGTSARSEAARLAGQVAEAGKEAGELRQQVAELRRLQAASAGELRDQLAAAQRQASELASQLASAQSGRSDLQSSLDNATARSKVLAEQVLLLKAQLEEAGAAQRAADARAAAAEGRTAAADAGAAAAEASRAGAEARGAAAEARAAAAETCQAAAEARAEAADTRATWLGAEATDLHSRLDSATKLHQAASQDLKEQRLQLQGLQAHLAAAQREAREARQEAEAAAHDAGSTERRLQAEADALRRRRSAMDSNAKELEACLTAERANTAALQQQLDSAQQSLADLQAQKAEVSGRWERAQLDLDAERRRLQDDLQQAATLRSQLLDDANTVKALGTLVQAKTLRFDLAGGPSSGMSMGLDGLQHGGAGGRPMTASPAASARLNSMVREQQDKICSLQAALADAQNALAFSVSEVRRLEADAASRDGGGQAAAAAELQSLLDQKHALAEQLSLQVDDLTVQVDSMRAHNTELHKMAERLQREGAARGADADSLQQQLANANQQLEGFRVQQDGLLLEAQEAALRAASDVAVYEAQHGSNASRLAELQAALLLATHKLAGAEATIQQQDDLVALLQSRCHLAEERLQALGQDTSALPCEAAEAAAAAERPSHAAARSSAIMAAAAVHGLLPPTGSLSQAHLPVAAVVPRITLLPSGMASHAVGSGSHGDGGRSGSPGPAPSAYSGSGAPMGISARPGSASPSGKAAENAAGQGGLRHAISSSSMGSPGGSRPGSSGRPQSAWAGHRPNSHRGGAGAGADAAAGSPTAAAAYLRRAGSGLSAVYDDDAEDCVDGAPPGHTELQPQGLQQNGRPPVARPFSAAPAALPSHARAAHGPAAASSFSVPGPSLAWGDGGSRGAPLRGGGGSVVTKQTVLLLSGASGLAGDALALEGNRM